MEDNVNPPCAAYLQSGVTIMHYLNQTDGQTKESKISYRTLRSSEKRSTPISNHAPWSWLS
jgi:hypothetical protein